MYKRIRNTMKESRNDKDYNLKRMIYVQHIYPLHSVVFLEMSEYVFFYYFR